MRRDVSVALNLPAGGSLSLLCMSRKPRSDSKLGSLTPSQKETLRGWLVDENLSYEKVKERLHMDFNVTTSAGALSEFYAAECFSLRSSQARQLAERVGEELKKGGDHFDAATAALIKQKAFERAMTEGADIGELVLLLKALGDMAKLRLKEKDQVLAGRRVALLEERMSMAKASLTSALDSAKSKGGLTPETLKQIEEAAALL
jgi:hypothetical protein